MAYNIITDTELLPGKPGSSSLFTRLRDNAIAIAQGLSGAPKILDAAFNTNSINGNKLVTGSVTATQLAANSVASSELKTDSGTRASFTLAASTSTLIPAGLLTIAPINTSITLQVRDIGGTWRGSSGGFQGGAVFSDGVNVRFFNTAAVAYTAYYFKLT